MNPFQIIEWAIGLAPKVIKLFDGVRVRRPSSRSTWDRPHYWTVEDFNADPWVYTCQWCKLPRTAANKAIRCKGPAL